MSSCGLPVETDAIAQWLLSLLPAPFHVLISSARRRFPPPSSFETWNPTRDRAAGLSNGTLRSGLEICTVIQRFLCRFNGAHTHSKRRADKLRSSTETANNPGLCCHTRIVAVRSNNNTPSAATCLVQHVISGVASPPTPDVPADRFHAESEPSQGSL